MKVYLFRAALWCEACGDKYRAENVKPPHVEESNESSFDSDEWPKGPYRDGGGEADSPQHCDGCGVFLENPLTDDGRAYVAESRLTPISAHWRRFYGIEAGGLPLPPADLCESRAEIGGPAYSPQAEKARRDRAGKLAHWAKYESAALAYPGGPEVIALIVESKWKAPAIAAALASDEWMNNLPLAAWDGLTHLLARRVPGIGNSLGERVCLLKHVARWHVAPKASAMPAGPLYVAELWRKGGRGVIFTSAPHTTRTDAAREVFAAYPRAEIVTTSRAHDGKASGLSIEWIKRRDLRPEGV